MKYKWKVFEIHNEEELEVASGETNNKQSAKRELSHYAFQYAQDCPIKVWKNWEEKEGAP
jgi:hypothetical protein